MNWISCKALCNLVTGYSDAQRASWVERSLRNGQHVGLRHIRAFPRVCRYTRVVKLAAADVEQERTVVEDTGAAPVPDAAVGEGSAPRTRGFGERNRRERPPGARRGPPKEITKPFKDIQEGDVLSGTVVSAERLQKACPTVSATDPYGYPCS